MDYLKQFKIPYAGLALGEHKFEYDIDNQLFEHFGNTFLKTNNLHVDLLFKKQETMLILGFNAKGAFEVICDRCAGEFELPVAGNWELILKLGDEDKELSDNMVMINRNAHEINISQYIYEFTTLLLPQRKVHPPDEKGNSTCDEKTVDIIEKLANKQPDADPRWEALKKLKLK